MYAKNYIPPDWDFVVVIVNTPMHMQVFTVTAMLFTHNCTLCCIIVQ